MRGGLLLCLAAARIGADVCHYPRRDRSAAFRHITVSLAATALLLIAFRILSRHSGTHDSPWGWDDALIIITGVSSMPLAILSGFFSHYGLGTDVWYFPVEDFTSLYKCFFAQRITYCVTTGLVKISLLAFYLRIFPSRTFQRLTWALICFVSMWTFMFTILQLNQCNPISYVWTRWDTDNKGRCLNYTVMVYIHAGTNLALELVILFMPMPILYNLRIDWRKKVQVFIMFSKLAHNFVKP